MMHDFSMTTDWLRARAEASPQALAYLIDGRRYTFGEIDGLVTRLCGWLRREGAAAGEHIGMWLPNSLMTVCSVFAAARLGAVLVPLNGRLTATELAWQLERGDCGRLLCLAGDEAQARTIAGGRIPVHTLPESAVAFESWLNVMLADFNVSPLAALDALQAIIFTSGTTGFPKGAQISFGNVFWSAIGSAFKLGTRADDRWLACLPLYHVGGLAVLFRSCLYGTAVALQSSFDVDAVLRSLRTEAITLVSLVPTMLGRLLDAGLTADSAPNLRLVLLGGAAAPADLLEAAAAAGLPVATTYGLTESASQIVTALPDEATRKPGSVGRPLIFTRIAVVDEAGQTTPPNEPGEIVVAGPTVMSGYYRDDAATAAALRDGWLHSGDIGYLDEDGDLWVLDRRADLIVSGGENVYPAEVERVLRAHPEVAAACVVGLPHPDWGRQVAALVVRSPGATLSEEALLAFSRERLAGYKQPRTLAFVDELPLTGSGKVQRGEVARLLAAMRATA